MDLARKLNAASAAALDAELGNQTRIPETDAHAGPGPPSPMKEDPVQAPEEEAAPGLQLLQTLEGHSDRVWVVAWSPDGARIRPRCCRARSPGPAPAPTPRGGPRHSGACLWRALRVAAADGLNPQHPWQPRRGGRNTRRAESWPRLPGLAGAEGRSIG